VGGKQVLLTIFPFEADDTSLTSSIFVAEVREPPDVSKTDGIANAGQEEFQLAAPRGPAWSVDYDGFDIFAFLYVFLGYITLENRKGRYN
jgi:hypothetical protein